MSGSRRVLLLGLPYFGKSLAASLRARGWPATYRPHPGRDPRGWAALLPDVARAAVVYLISSRIERGSPQDYLMRVRRRPVVIHWVGTDVLIAREAFDAGNVSPRLAGKAVHWSDAPWLVDELGAIGIRSEYVPLPVGLPSSQPPPLPSRFRVLLYLPVDAFDREVFEVDTILALPRELPEVDFLLVPSPAGNLPGPLAPNLEARGWVEDVDALYRDISLYVRLTSHDGMSFMALESLARGRYVIWTYPLEGAIHASGVTEVAGAIRGLYEQHLRGELLLNLAGRQATLDRFDASAALDEIEARLRALV